MKKTLKNIIICICILYFILSIGYVVVCRGLYSESIKGLDGNCLFDGYSQTYTIIDHLKGQYQGMLYILDDIIKIGIISIIMGILLGLIVSSKENSVVKYITMFIFGYLLYCILWTIITILINKSVSDIISNNFMNIYIGTFTNMFVSYIMFYSAIILGIILKNKMQVNLLNDELKNPNKKEKTTRIMKFIKIFTIILITLIVSIFIVNTGRKTIILINYSKKVNEMSKCNNYYMKEEIKSNDLDNVNEIYHKDNETVYKNKEYNSIEYSNKDTKEYLYYNVNQNKIVILDNDINIKMHDIRNYFFIDTNVKKWGNIIKALYTNIKSEKYNGKDYYVIKYNNDKLYLNKLTYLVDRMVRITETKTLEKGLETNEIVNNYTYEFGNVTDEDVAKPDMTGFTIEKNK